MVELPGLRVVTLVSVLAVLLSGCGKNSLNKKLAHAAACGHVTTMKVLLGLGADVNARDDTRWKYNRTVLMVAAYEGKVGAVGLLLENGADVNARDDEGGTALGHALMAITVYVSRSNNNRKAFSNVEIARMLIERGADVNVKGCQSYLMSAVESAHYAPLEETYQMVKLLIDNNADVNVVSSDGCTALDLAYDPEIVKLLEDAGAVHGEKCQGRAYT